MRVDPSLQKDFGAKELYNTGRGRCVNAQAFSLFLCIPCYKVLKLCSFGNSKHNSFTKLSGEMDKQGPHGPQPCRIICHVLKAVRMPEVKSSAVQWRGSLFWTNIQTIGSEIPITAARAPSKGLRGPHGPHISG